jgi:hypothetical protein
MFLEDIAVHILVNSTRYSTQDEALRGLKSEFKAHFPMYSYEQWNRDIPEALAKNIITNVGKNSNVSVRFVIKDLETICNTI